MTGDTTSVGTLVRAAQLAVNPVAVIVGELPSYWVSVGRLPVTVLIAAIRLAVSVTAVPVQVTVADGQDAQVIEICSVGSSPVKATDWRSLKLAGAAAVVASISSTLRWEKYGSEWACRLSAPQMPAYAITEDPDPGSTEVLPLRLPVQARLLNVWLPPIW